ncbi:hypothetical protein B0H12DRAFT_1326331 [Mycena haematopus]|nr:hypothetical protein B0H12DRAFT_1326331 [Mycena haematopus]
MQKFEEPLVQLRDMMERLAKKLHHNPSRSNFTRRFTWSLWGKNEIQEGLDVVERFKGLLTVWLELDIWDFARDTAREYHDHTLATIKDATEQRRIDHDHIFKSVRVIAQYQEQHHSAAERDVVIEWYSPLNFFLRQADIFRIRQPGTGRWFLETKSFREWKSAVGKTLWCRGMPGAGKTVLVSIAVDHLRAEQEHCDIVGVAAIYLNHKETDAHAPSTLLTSLWRQLVVGQSIAPVDQLYQKHREPCTKPSLDEDHTVLCSTISRYLKVFILVDALDEYPERERNILIWYLSQLGSNVNLLLTSRPHISLNIHGAQLEVLEVRAIEEDIRRHIDAQIHKSPRLSEHIQNCPDLLEQIEKKIVRRSDGMFLMAKLHIDSLTSKHTVKAVQDTLKRLPNDLESTYDEVMERIRRQSEDDRNLALRTLSWIFNAKRILRPSELRAALAVEPGTTKLDPNNLVAMNTILSVCAGLLTTSSAYRPRHFPAHQPRSQYMHRISILQHIPTENGRSVYALPQTLLPRLCPGILPHTRTRGTGIRDNAIDYFVSPHDAGGWWELWNWKHKYRKGPTSGSPLLIAALFRLEDVCQHILDTDGPGNALQLAAMDGLTDAVQFLLGKGVDVLERKENMTAHYTLQLPMDTET